MKGKQNYVYNRYSFNLATHGQNMNKIHNQKNEENNLLNHQNMFIFKICNTYNTMMNDTYVMTIHFWDDQIINYINIYCNTVCFIPR